MKISNTDPIALNLPKSLLFIINELNNQKDLKPTDIARLLKEANVKEGELEAWADLKHPPQDSYGRKLIYAGQNFEIMVMSWQPGDFSAIHDHGQTQWGAVQIFGPAEHATFRVIDNRIVTLARWDVQPGDIIGVSRNLIHQMGNPTTDTPFISLHVYGKVENTTNVTGDARVFDLRNQTIQRVDGGVFFALPTQDIKRLEPGPEGDFFTRLRHMVELVNRMYKIDHSELENATKEAFEPSQKSDLFTFIQKNLTQASHFSDSKQWRILNRELIASAKLQNKLRGEENTADLFHKYAEVYDSVICNPCLDHFMRDYLKFVVDSYQLHLGELEIFSIGCGTGLVETFLVNELGAQKDKLYGIDISAAMVNEARNRIHADVGDVLTLDPSVKLWDIAFSGLNVFHYLDFNRLEEAIHKTAAILKEGGYFIGDFITPDHIRWYPNVLFSTDDKTVSLRTPTLIEEEGRMFLESEITHINFDDSQMRVYYSGKHKRFLPPMHRIRSYFEKAFSEVSLYDAKSLHKIPEWADSCTSTRYVIVAKK